MKRLLWLLLVLGGAGSLARAASFYISPDVPTTETATAATLLPPQVFRYTSPGPTYAFTLAVPGNPHLDGVHKMDKPGFWLFSVESVNDLGGSLGGLDADPRDVIRADVPNAVYSFFFCGAGLIPSYANVDAVYLIGGDTGDLVLSFDVPTTIGATTFLPGDLVRYVKTGLPCTAWAVAAGNPYFNSAAAGVPITTNVTDADEAAGVRLLTFDVPTTIGATTFLPGDIVAESAGTFTVLESLVGWPISSGVPGLSAPANPGRVPTTILVKKSATPGNIVITWSASCSEGAEDYGIYEGTIGSWYSHTMKDCNDGGLPLTEEVTPGSGNRYYLVVPHSSLDEGSYGVRSSGLERPVGAVRCVSSQVLAPCPP